MSIYGAINRSARALARRNRAQVRVPADSMKLGARQAVVQSERQRPYLQCAAGELVHPVHRRLVGSLPARHRTHLLGAVHRQVSASAGQMPVVLLADGTDPGSVLLQYGPGGALAAVALWWAWVMYKDARDNLKRERERNDALEGELRKQNEMFQQQVIPVLTRVTDALASFLRATRRGGDDP